MWTSNKPLLDRKAILGASDLVIEKVEVPEWGGYVYVRSLSGMERDAFEGSLVSKDGKNTVKFDNIRAKLVCKTACDETGKRLFTDADVAELTRKSASALQRLFETAQRLSGISDTAVQEATSELKNAQPEDSPSG
jgi:hypothetical protein